MTQVDQFKIVNNNNSRGLKFHFAQGYQDNVTINNVAFAQPGQAASQNFGANFGGFNRFINVDFVLHNDGTDKSTDGASKITLSQQIDYLMDDIIQGQSTGFSNVRFTLTIYRDSSTKTYIGVVEDVTINGDTNDGNFVRGSIRLRQTAAS